MQKAMVVHLAISRFAKEVLPAYEVAGLSYDTKFDPRNMVELPWNESFFSVPPNPSHGQTPKLGSLHIGMHRALSAAAQAIRQ
jgi:hypothetical protein